MTLRNIVCFGFGQVAKNFIKKIDSDGISFKLTTTSREETQDKKLDHINYQSFQFTEKGFDKTFINSGETKKIEICLDSRNFSTWDIETRQWKVKKGKFEILIGSSSNDIRLKDHINL